MSRQVPMVLVVFVLMCIAFISGKQEAYEESLESISPACVTRIDEARIQGIRMGIRSMAAKFTAEQFFTSNVRSIIPGEIANDGKPYILARSKDGVMVAVNQETFEVSISK